MLFIDLYLIPQSMANSRVAIVTGSAEGIGKGIALRLAYDGCDLVLNDLPSHSEKLNALAEEIKTKGKKAVICIGDVSVEADVEQVIAAAVTSFGGLDIVSTPCFFCNNKINSKFQDDCQRWYFCY
jgi:NAD(P)-dependent dehydrogenase (short-subunit alcohol dehydrogenase family)